MERGGTPTSAPKRMTILQRNASTEEAKQAVVHACERHGQSSIIALAGVPGTGKSYIGELAARDYASEDDFVLRVQFHQSFTYEEFVEGLRLRDDQTVGPEPGIFLRFNEHAAANPRRRFVLLIEELTRANVSAVLGELLTAIEYRDQPFRTLYGHRQTTIAKNVAILATFNPIDRTAIELDTAILRRLRIIRFLPSTAQLAEMLHGNGLQEQVIRAIQAMFEQVRDTHPGRYANDMPFGHGIFSEVENEFPDLHDLWHEKIVHILRRPGGIQPHPFTPAIEEAYPWRNHQYRLEKAEDKAPDAGERVANDDADIEPAETEESAAEAEDD